MSDVAIPEAAPTKPLRRRRWWIASSAAALAGLAATAAFVPVGGTPSASIVGAQSERSWLQDTASAQLPQRGWNSPSWQVDGGASATTSENEAATEASASESTGVVLIDTELGYDGGEGAGSGMVLTSDGLVLTNHHVIEGATTITVTIGTTGETYEATVVGSDSTNDVALLQLENASGLTTITIDDDETEAVGDAITAVGNASGGGVLMAADGTITELDATVTTSATIYEAGETLNGTIEVSADVVAGDSGGALLDDDGEVIGMTTAASSGLADTIAYAVTIEDALAIVDQILDGDESGTVTLGYPAFLGVGLSQWRGGANIAYVYPGTPAEGAGLVAGDTVTAVDGAAVASGDELAAAMAQHEAGDTVEITWVDAAGTTHTETVKLAQGAVA